jgi:diaminopimelate decarboxylase
MTKRPADVGKKQRSGKKVSSRYMRERWSNFVTQSKDGMMMIEGVRVDEIIKKYGTPLYVMVESEIRERMRRFKRTFGNKIRLQYAVKCSSNLEILRIAREEGFDLDCSSVGEVILGLLADFKPKQLAFTNLFKNEQDLFFAAKMGIQAITGDSLEDIAHIAATAKKLKKHIDTMIRVNPMLQIGSYSTKKNKYGIPLGYVDRAVDLAVRSPYVDFQGFHFMGGYVYNPKVFKAAARVFVKIIKRLQDRGIRVKRLSLGGGFPAAIGEQEAFPIEEMKDFPEFFQKLLDKNGIDHHVELIFEPGKSLTLNAGIGLMKVIAKKRLGQKLRVVIADGSTYNFIPDALFQTGITYDILPASKLNAPRIHNVTIAGNTCDCWDLIAEGVGMPKLRANDLLAVMDVGAYAQVLANNFNTIRRAAMVMIRPDGSLKQIRRRDRFSEMFAPELDVLKMAGPDELEKYNNLYRVNIDKIWKGGGLTKFEQKSRMKSEFEKLESQLHYKNGNGHKPLPNPPWNPAREETTKEDPHEKSHRKPAPTHKKGRVR